MVPVRPYVHSDPEDCTGCEICLLVCSIIHEGVIDPRNARLKVVGERPLAVHVSACHRCEEPACVRACPVGALTMDPDRWILVVNEEKCTHCGACVRACPFRVLKLHTRKKVPIACDLCGGKLTCIAYCPVKALMYSK